LTIFGVEALRLCPSVGYDLGISNFWRVAEVGIIADSITSSLRIGKDDIINFYND
jgi:hypothetical protein